MLWLRLMNSTKDWVILDLWFHKDNVLTDICCLITGMWAALTEFTHGGNFFFFTNFSWHNHWNRYCLLLSQWESGIYPSVAGFAVVFIFLGMVGWFHNRTQIVPLLLETLGFSIMALIMFKLNSYHWNSNSPAT